MAGSSSGVSGGDSSSLYSNLGIQIVDNNTLYIADFRNNRVVVIQPGSTNATAIIGSFGNAPNQLYRPADVFVTSTSIYILSRGNFRVQMWPKNGSSGITVAGTGVSGTHPSLTSFGFSFAMYVDKYGYLYVSDKENNRILRFPPDSTNGTSGVIVAGTGVLGLGPSELYYPEGLFVDDELNMYIADTNNNRIQKWAYGACSGVTLAGNGTQGNSTRQLNLPTDVVVDANGFMYITDQNNHRILRWLVGAPSGECIAGCSGLAGVRADQFRYPEAAVFDSNGLLYVSDYGNSRVQKFSLFSTSSEYSTSFDALIDDVGILSTCLAQLILSATARWTQFPITVAGSPTAVPGSGPSALALNQGIRIVDNYTLYIADKGNHRIVFIQPNSTNATAIIGSGPGTAMNQFQEPTDVFVTSTSIYVLDALNYRVQMWLRNGSTSTTVAGITGSMGNSSSTTTFGYSYGIYVDNVGFLYVSDQPNHRVLRFTPGSVSGATGVVVAGTGISGSGPSQLNTPSRLFVDEARSIYIADSANHRIQRWMYGACYGVTVAGTGTSGNTTSQLSYPVSVIVDTNQIMYIGDQGNNRIHRWTVGDCSGQCIVGCTLANGSASDQFYLLQAMAFDSQGALYVSDGGNHRVQKSGLLKDFSTLTYTRYSCHLRSHVGQSTSTPTMLTSTTWASTTLASQSFVSGETSCTVLWKELIHCTTSRTTDSVTEFNMDVQWQHSGGHRWDCSIVVEFEQRDSDCGQQHPLHCRHRQQPCARRPTGFHQRHSHHRLTWQCVQPTELTDGHLRHQHVHLYSRHTQLSGAAMVEKRVQWHHRGWHHWHIGQREQHHDLRNELWHLCGQVRVLVCE